VKDVSAIYTAEWFHGDFKDLQPEFDIVADVLFEHFAPEHVVDVGCGPGNTLLRLLVKHSAPSWGSRDQGTASPMPMTECGRTSRSSTSCKTTSP
jgi:hypothetical protein